MIGLRMPSPAYPMRYSDNSADVIGRIFIGKKMTVEGNGLFKGDLAPLWFLDEGQIFRTAWHRAIKIMTLVHRVFKEVRISYAEVYADNLICFGGKTEAKLFWTSDHIWKRSCWCILNIDLEWSGKWKLYI